MVNVNKIFILVNKIIRRNTFTKTRQITLGLLVDSTISNSHMMICNKLEIAITYNQIHCKTILDLSLLYLQYQNKPTNAVMLQFID